MNILSAVLPGLREMRTPLAVGALWLAAVALVAGRWWDDIVQHVPAAALLDEVDSLSDLTTTVPAIAGASFLAYLLGCGAVPLSSWFAALVSSTIDAFVDWTRAGHREYRFPRIVRRIETPRERREAIVRDVVDDEYARNSLPREAATAFEWRLVDRELESLSMQLWSRASDQYQEYDRVRAERAFRSGVSLPLIGVGVSVAVTQVWWLGFPLIALSLVLAVQARFLEEEQRELMANALRARLVTSPLLERVVATIAAAEVNDDATWAHWNALTAVAMARVGHGGAAGAAHDRAMSSLIDGVDLLDGDAWQTQVRARGESLIARYNEEGDSDFAIRASADVRFRCDRIEHAKKNPTSMGLERATGPQSANQILTQYWHEIAPPWGAQAVPPELRPYYPPSALHHPDGAGGK